MENSYVLVRIYSYSTNSLTNQLSDVRLYKPLAHDIKTFDLDDNFKLGYSIELIMKENSIVRTHFPSTKGIIARNLYQAPILFPTELYL